MSLFPHSFQKNVSERIASFRILFEGNIIENMEGTKQAYWLEKGLCVRQEFMTHGRFVKWHSAFAWFIW